MNNILLSLQITALGMGIVFGAILLLWLMMSLLTRATADKESASGAAGAVPLTPHLSPTGREEGGEGYKAQAAAIAVAMAIAEQRFAQPLSEPPTALVSAWQLGMRTRQMYQKGDR